MIEWTKYRRADGEWAEVGAFILEASANGSWVVRHKLGAVPCRCSADLGTMQPGGIDAAKASCERVLAEVLAAPNGPQALASTAAIVQQRAITLALCNRYQSMRALQREGSATGKDESMNKAAASLEELDRRVDEYLQKNRS